MNSKRHNETQRKKFADRVKKHESVEKVEQKIKQFNEKDFIGDVYLNYFKIILKPFLLEDGLCIQDNNYKWLEFYDYNSKVRLTAIYDENSKIVEWYFDIAKRIGKENNIPYEDDIYLDVVLRPDGEIILLDEDELKEAYERKEITKEEYDEAYKIANNLIEKIRGKVEEINKFTDKYLKEMI